MLHARIDAGTAQPLARSYVRDLSMGVFHRWEPKRLFMFWTVQLDESGTDGQSPFWIMAGVIAPAQQWEAFDLAWGEMLLCEHIPHVHCSRMFHGKAPFQDWDTERTSLLIEHKAAPILSAHIPLTVTAIMRKDDYRSIYHADGKSHGPKDTFLGILYRATVGFCVNILQDYGVDT